MINKTVTDTKSTIDNVLRIFLLGLFEIRNMDKSGIPKYIEQFYFRIDLSFRQWMESVDIGDDKDEKEI